MRGSTCFRLSFLLLGALVLACGGKGGGHGPDLAADADALLVDEVSNVDVQVEVPAADEVAEEGGAEDLDVEDGEAGPWKCATGADCEGFEVGDCQRPVCDKHTGKCTSEWVETCCLDKNLFEADFEGGLPEGFHITDTNEGDRVTWVVDDNRRAFGEKSLYLGDPKCHTYYNGGVDDNCQPCDPGNADCTKATMVKVRITTPKFYIPPTLGTKVASFYLWMEGEPPVEGSAVQPDQLTVSIVSKAGEKVAFSSADIANTTGGKFMFVAINLGGYEDEEVALQFAFNTLDGNDNLYEGVYIDQLEVTSYCNLDLCEEGETCPDDGEDCTTDECVIFRNSIPNGYCGYPLVPTCVNPECTPETVAQDCTEAGVCQIAKCVDGSCEYEADPKCCNELEVFTADFDDGSLQGFSVLTHDENASVKWQVSDARSTSGDSALYYGDLVKKNYESVGANYGYATSPAMELPSDGNVFLTFNLFLSTEFDNSVPQNYWNPLRIDLFEVSVVENLGSPDGESETTVWSSHKVYGTTNGSFLPVGIDLTDFAGKKIWLRFKFQTWDEQSNDFEGVYVDDIRVVWSPSAPGCKPRRDCMTTYDCDIDGVCRTGDCVESVCQVEMVGTPPDCCFAGTDCDDDNPCTMEDCIDNKCESTGVIEGPGCCQEKVVQEFHFDDTGALDSFQIEDDGSDVKWQLTDQQSVSEPYSLYFGNGKDYDNGGVAAGSVLSPPIQIPSLGTYVLSMWVYLDIDSDPIFDIFKLDVVQQDMTPQTVFTKKDVPESEYKKFHKVGDIDLSGYGGKTIRLRFSFHSVDHLNNGGFGVAVDDVRIDKICPAQ